MNSPDRQQQRQWRRLGVRPARRALRRPARAPPIPAVADRPAATSAPIRCRTSPPRPSPRSRARPQTEAELAARALSDALVAELEGGRPDRHRLADVQFRHELDAQGLVRPCAARRRHLPLRARTARKGCSTGKKAVVIESRAGFYSEGPAAAMDGQEPHIRTLLGFMGIDRRHLRPRREARLRAGGGRGGDRRGGRGARHVRRRDAEAGGLIRPASSCRELAGALGQAGATATIRFAR